MKLNFKIFIGGLIVMAACFLTINSNFPILSSPYSLIVTIPLLLASFLQLDKESAYLLSLIPLVSLYLFWSLIFIKPPYTIPKPTLWLVVFFIILSTVFNVYSFQYGVKYQGLTHTLVMYAYNVIFMTSMFITYQRNVSNPNIINCLGFNIIFFSWLGWSAFPWLGELM